MDLVTVKKCSELTGLSPNAIDCLRKRGQLQKDVHWIKSPTGRIFIDMKKLEKWIKGQSHV